MKNILLTLFFLQLYFIGFTQIVFEPGYFIDKRGEKINCLIKNQDWKNNPVEVEYKLSEGGEINTFGVAQVKEFGIVEGAKYISSYVNIDRSSDLVDRLSLHIAPSFKKEGLFLKVLVEGKANLYEYEDGALRRYFYNTDSIQTEQLIYKRYLTRSKNIGQNNTYHQQLLNNVNCDGANLTRIQNVKYTKAQLVKYFVDYNSCKQDLVTVPEKRERRDFLNISLRPGVTYHYLGIEYFSSPKTEVNFGNEVGLKVGVEAEFILPFNKDKWGILFEPNLQSYRAASLLENRRVVIDYKYLELPLGIRHYFFLNQNSKFFVNGLLVLSFDNDSYIEFEGWHRLKIMATNNYALGFGYNYHNQYSIELRYGTRRNLLLDHANIQTNFSGLSLNFGYTIF